MLRRSARKGEITLWGLADKKGPAEKGKPLLFPKKVSGHTDAD